jgi:hypothetical protein
MKVNHIHVVRGVVSQLKVVRTYALKKFVRLKVKLSIVGYRLT